MYHSVKTVDESRIYLNNNSALYYYLVLNNHTLKYDTISASTKNELKTKVLKVTKPKEEKEQTSKVLIALFAVILIVLGYAFFSSPVKTEKEEN